MAAPGDADVALAASRFLNERRAGRRCSIDDVLKDFPQLGKDAASRSEALRLVARLARAASLAEAAASSGNARVSVQMGEGSASNASIPVGGANVADALPAELPEVQGYDVIDLIGRGGMGAVYEAYQQSTGRRVAIKFMLASAAGSAAGRRRFEREAELVARLEHPHIVGVLDSGFHRANCYFVMEYVDGRPFDEFVGLHAAPGSIATPATDDVLRLLATVADAVDHAHQRGVLHRDLKPSNILVDARSQPHLLDFGLAKLLTGSAEAARTLTLSSPGQVLGTLAYMSPEQSRGDDGAISVRSDVYALGAITYEMLTGRTPINVDGALADVLLRIALHDPPAPSALLARDSARWASAERKTPPDGRAALPPPDRQRRSWWRRGRLADLDAVLFKALDKDPARRYASARELAEDLRRIANNEIVQARRVGPVTRALRWTARRRGMAATVAVALAAVLATVVIAFVRISHARDRAQTIAQQLAVQVTRVQKMTQFTFGMIDRVARESAQGRDTAPLLAMLTDAETRLDAEFREAPVEEAQLRHQIGITYWNLGHWDKGEANLRRAMRLMRELDQESTADFVTLEIDLAGLRGVRGDSADALQLMQHAVAIARRIYAPRDTRMSGAIFDLGMLLAGNGQLDQAEVVFNDELTRRQRLFGGRSRVVVGVLEGLAEIHKQRGNVAESAKLYRDLVSICRQHADKDPIMLGRELGNLSTVVGLRDLHEAEGLQRESVAMLENAAGAGHAVTLWAKNLLAATYLRKFDLAGAEGLYREILDVHARGARGEDIGSAAAIANLGAVVFQRGMYAEAASLFGQGADLFARLSVEPAPDHALLCVNQASALDALGSLEAARRACGQALDLCDRTKSPDTHARALAWSALASIQHHAGDDQSAETLYRQALDALRRESSSSADAAPSIMGLAEVLATRSEFGPAMELYREAIGQLGSYVGDDHPDTAIAYVGLAAALRDSGDYVLADKAFRQAYGALRTHLDHDHPYVATCLDEWSKLFAAEGDAATANTLWTAALQIRQSRLPADHPDIVRMFGIEGVACATERAQLAQPTGQVPSP